MLSLNFIVNILGWYTLNLVYCFVVGFTYFYQICLFCFLTKSLYSVDFWYYFGVSSLSVVSFVFGYAFLWKRVSNYLAQRFPLLSGRRIFMAMLVPLILVIGNLILDTTIGYIRSVQSDRDEIEFENVVFATSPKVTLRTTSSNESLESLSFQWTFHLDERFARGRSTFISDGWYNFIPPEVNRDCAELGQEKRALKTTSGDIIIDTQSYFNEIWSSSSLPPGGYIWEVTYLVHDMGNQYLEKCSIENMASELAGQTIIVQKRPPLRIIKTFTVGNVKVEK